MLQKVEFEDDFQPLQEDRSYLLQPAFYWEVIQRRWVYFMLPFVTILAAGAAAAVLWPPTYLSEGRILVQSQQIPSELVRPTVTSAAQERIQVIQQRTMTRDNLIAIADKFRLFPDKRTLMSPTEIVAEVKKHTKIAPVDLQIDFKQRTRAENPTIVFSVGFEYSNAAIAAQVANELMTRILNEDLRDRTSRATDTTKFLGREVQRLQAENSALDAKIAQLRITQGRPASSNGADQSTSTLTQLKSELIQKGALYSERHPLIQSLKKQIEALEKVAAAPVATNDAATVASLEVMVAQQESLQKSLDAASAKLAAARLGENLEKDQQSEKLEIIEQPTAPQDPVKPNRLKVLAMAFAAALFGGAGLAVLMELLDKGIRRSNDLLSVVDGQLIISIPYISTAAETRTRRRRILVGLGAIALVAVGLLVVVYLFLPPLDLMIAKAKVGLFR
ncbi:GumC domain-containing protein [Bradyrhizobium roseum]|uniref:sugar transporter n=1 Tax=Bradyrhizobium roseum TaxID=3056648 RepID=UPI0026120DB5|nr:sugar transporter [Bradyrhizobium roseus]WKA30635.1 sugar transporter [Bradyrhizobium roseus]